MIDADLSLRHDPAGMPRVLTMPMHGNVAPMLMHGVHMSPGAPAAFGMPGTPAMSGTPRDIFLDCT